MSASYSLLVRTVDGIMWKADSKPGKTPSLYVAIYRDGVESKRTPTIKQQLTPTWDYLLKISSDPPASTISFRVFHDSSLPFVRDKCLGSVETTIPALVKLCDSDRDATGVKLELSGGEGELQGRPAGTLCVRFMREADAAALGIDKAQKDVANVALGAALASVTSKLEIVIRIGDEISTLHPYANMAWKVLTSVYQTVKTQQETDEKLLKLFETMNEVYSFVVDADFVADKIKSLEEKALAIVKQTVECAVFVQEYTTNGFCNRTVRGIWMQPDKKIDELCETLLKLRASFDGRLGIQGLFLSTKALEKLEGLEQSDTLKKLNPVDMNAALRAVCLSGTRRDILDDIAGWLSVPSDSGNILWLSGVAGSGKSTISTTVSEYFRGLDRLGAFLFFDRNDRSRSHPNGVIRTIAHSLGVFNPHIGSAISAAINRDPAVVNSPMRTQFRELLLHPLLSVERYIQGPILVILDALDECGDPESRTTLLSILADDFRKLPQLYRLLITSRRDSDIVDQFRSHFSEMYLDTTAPSSTEDVDLFFRHEFGLIQQRRKLGPTWPGEDKIRLLVRLSGGLFIWASTATRFMNGYRPDERLETLVTQESTQGFSLDDLYSTALRESAPWDTDKSFAHDARAVLACVVLGRVPMTDGTIDMLLYSGQQRSGDVLEYLGCVVQWSQGKEARTLHASFADYITDPARSGGEPWAIDLKTDHHSLSLGCLWILNHELRFNICALEDSHRRNADVPNMADRVAQRISPQLSYASSFWFDHIQKTPFDKALLNDLGKFFHHQFIYWLEVLSLTGQIPIAPAALTVAGRYAKGQGELEDLIAGALRFVVVFSPAIAQSAPHIYLSALPFAPRSSTIVNQYGSMFPKTLQFQSPMGDLWPSIQMICQGHSEEVLSVHFSPDGMRFVSGSLDNTLRVWDAQTGEFTTEPLEGHTEWVTSVHFSPDGARIVSGSRDKTVRVWDARTGTLCAGPFTGHNDSINSVRFSPDGARIASGSSDKTVRVWDARTGAVVVGPLDGHIESVTSVSFSPDGTRIASGSWDSTVRIWDSTTGARVAGPFKGHTDFVTSVDFSPNGAWIASGSMDNTLRVWDAETGALVAGPLEGHTGAVTSVNFSPEGALIASGSEDRTLRIWDAQTGVQISRAFEGHNGPVTCVHFSPDGARIASAGGEDNRVRVWGTEPSVHVTAQFEGHTDWVVSVQYSPDGTRIASGSSTICVWDGQSGGRVAGPFDGPVSSVDFSPDGARIVSALEDNTVGVWDAHTGTLRAGPFKGHTDSVCAVQFSPDGTRIASASQDETVRIWDAETGAALVGPFEAHSSLISVKFSPDGTRIASGSADNKVRVWDAHTAALVAEPFDGHTNCVFCVDFSPDGTRITSGSQDKTVRVWDAQTGRLIVGPFEGHTGEVSCVQFSPNGLWIASGAWDNTVRVWDAHTGTIVAGPFEGHTMRVFSVNFSPESTHVVSGSADNTLRVWELNSSVTSPLGHYPRVEDGWVLSSAGDLMFWVPPWLRDGLYFPRNRLVICASGTTKLDLSRFVHGTEWQKCIDSKVRDTTLETS